MSMFLITRLSTRAPSVFRHIVAGLATNTGSADHIDGLVKGKKVVVFMKGTPETPRCGFSNGIMQILNFHGVKTFETHNVLEDEELRQGIKEYSNWPTIPQVYIDGEFVGGMDIMLDMHKNGELVEELKKVGIRSVLLDKDNSPDRQG